MSKRATSWASPTFPAATWVAISVPMAPQPIRPIFVT